MKKDMVKNLIVATLIGVPLVFVMLWQAGLGTSMDSIFKADTLADLEAQQQALRDARDSSELEGSGAVFPTGGTSPNLRMPFGGLADQQQTARESLQRAQSTLGSLPSNATPQQRTDAQTAVTNAQTASTAADTALRLNEEELRKVGDKLDATPERRKQRLNEYYKALIEANKQKGIELESKKGATAEEDAIIDDQVIANGYYTDLLYAKWDVEVCQVDNPPCADLESFMALQNTAAAKLRDQIALLTEAESVINRGMQFEVSKIFRPAGQAVKKLSFLQVTNRIANWMITLVSSLAVTALIIGGFMMIISAGDETRLETGKTIFTYSLIGLAVTLMAYGIIATIQSLFY